jgi:uncharacterized protein YbjT (DUF2867 family)
MMKSEKTLVIGATGNQGGAVAAELMRARVPVVAMVRDVDSAKAKALGAAGVELVAGDLDDTASVADAMRGVANAFAVTALTPDVALEISQGHNLVAAAEKAGLQHLVFSSVASADKATGVPHFDSKFKIEQAIRKCSVPWTITAPVTFHENLLFPWILEGIKGGTFRRATPAGAIMQQVAVADIGALNAAVLAGSAKYHGQRIELASDELSGDEAAKQLSAELNRAIRYEEQPVAEIRAHSEGLAVMFEWLSDVGFSVDIPALHGRFPSVPWTSFREWTASVYRVAEAG